VIDEAVAALERGEPIVLPTDTVYGLAASAEREEYTARMYRVKGRRPTQPTALVAADVEHLLELLPELRGDHERIVRALLPGPFTLIVPNPARRFVWLTGTNPDAIGVRVPAVDGPGAGVLRRVGAVVATSANRPGGRDPRTLADVPEEIRNAVGALVDAGALPGTPSTVLDLTGEEPLVLRAGAVPAAEALARVAAALP
jgi:L-threonylcarbamoyladenylate synthase